MPCCRLGGSMLHAESPVDIHCDRHWGTRPRKNSEIHIDVSHSRQPLVKGERLVRYEVNTVMSDLMGAMAYRLGKLTTRATHSANKLARRLRTRRRHARRRSMGEAQHEGTTDVQCVCVCVVLCCLVLSCVVLCCLVLRRSLTQRSLGVLLLTMCQARATRESV